MEILPIRCLIPDLERERNLKPHQVYEAIGLSKQHYSAYRTGRRIPKLVISKIIAEFFNVPIDDLHEWPDITFPRKGISNRTE